jgi:hypothetical protein
VAPRRSRFPCLTSIAGQIIYYLTRGVPGGQITRYFGYHTSVEPKSILARTVVAISAILV